MPVVPYLRSISGQRFELDPVAERVAEGTAEQAGQSWVNRALKQFHVDDVSAAILVSRSSSSAASCIALNAIAMLPGGLHQQDPGKGGPARVVGIQVDTSASSTMGVTSSLAQLTSRWTRSTISESGAPSVARSSRSKSSLIQVVPVGRSQRRARALAARCADATEIVHWHRRKVPAGCTSRCWSHCRRTKSRAQDERPEARQLRPRRVGSEWISFCWPLQRCYR